MKPPEETFNNVTQGSERLRATFAAAREGIGKASQRVF
jgi:hypothetical protein